MLEKELFELVLTFERMLIKYEEITKDFKEGLTGEHE